MTDIQTAPPPDANEGYGGAAMRDRHPSVTCEGSTRRIGRLLPSGEWESTRDVAERIAFELEGVEAIMFLISCSEVIEEAEANAVSFLGNKVRELAEEQRQLISVIRDEVV